MRKGTAGRAIGEKIDYDFQQTVSVRVALNAPESPRALLSLEAVIERVTSVAPSPEMCFTIVSLLRKEP